MTTSRKIALGVIGVIVAILLIAAIRVVPLVLAIIIGVAIVGFAIASIRGRR